MMASLLGQRRANGKKKQLDATTRMLLLASLVALLLVIAVAIFAPAMEDDPTPATWNTGSAGAKAAMLLSSLGYHAAASEQPLASFVDRLPVSNAAQTTLILAEPRLPGDDACLGLKELARLARLRLLMRFSSMAGRCLLRDRRVRRCWIEQKSGPRRRFFRTSASLRQKGEVPWLAPVR